jgi:TonB family protein
MRILPHITVTFAMVAALFTCEHDSTAEPAGAHQQLKRASRTLSMRQRGPRHQIKLAGKRVKTVQLCATRWTLKAYPQSVDLGHRMERRYMRMPERERIKHMNRIQRCIQLWWSPAGNLKEQLRPARRSPHPHHRELAHLGQKGGSHWYAFAPIHDWIRLQREMALRGGDDPLEGALRGLRISGASGDPTSTSCHYVLAKAGPRALPYIERAIQKRLPQRGRAVNVLRESRDRAVTAWLIRRVSSTDREVREAARGALLAQPPRAEAKELYARWLGEKAGKEDLFEELYACHALRVEGVRKHLPRVLARPGRMAEYRMAKELSRQLAGRPFAKAILEAERAFLRGGCRRREQTAVDKLVKAVLRAGDPEAAAVVAASLAAMTSKGGCDSANAAGVRILRKLPRRAGRKLVFHLVKRCRPEYCRNRFAWIQAKLEGKGPPPIRIKRERVTIGPRPPLSKVIIRRVFNYNRRAINACFQKLKRAPIPGERIVVRFTVNPEGRVMRATVKSSTTSDPRVQACVAKAVRSFRFPRPWGGASVTVTYPFVVRR